MAYKQIKYYSTNRKAPEVKFSEALLKGLAPDGGLYMPDSFPKMSQEEIEGFAKQSYNQIATTILEKYVGSEISKEDLSKLCSEAYNFEVPLERVSGRKYIMRLDQGPTASFKDFAARMMSSLMQYFLSAGNQHLTILTATSGDTGSAVANAFYGHKNINVVILFPANEVSVMQRKQMTTPGGNITAISVNGKFDDCQKIVKKAFNDPELSSKQLSSANSINIGRLIPQSVYYFYALSRLATNSYEKAVFSIPSGNFGNLMGGLIAAKMGMPFEKFIAATNSNNEVPELLRTGIYKPVIPSINCISSAMNVGHPSNLARIVSLYGGEMDQNGKINRDPDFVQMRRQLFGVSFNDEQTRDTIRNVYRKYNILLEPHGAIAWQGIIEYIRETDGSDNKNKLFISLETAHPGKFPEEMDRILSAEPLLPDSLKGLEGKKEYYNSIENNYSALKKIIVNSF